MKSFTRRHSAFTMVVGLVLATVAVGVTSTTVQAAPGTLTTPNACKSLVTGTYSDIPWTLTGTGAPNPVTLGSGDITLSGATASAFIPATLLIAAYNLGILTTGVNSIPTKVWLARSASNVDVGAGVSGVKVQVDQVDVTLSTTVTDPNGAPGSGDETATPMSLNIALPDFTVTPLGGDVKFSQAAPGSIPTIAVGVAGPTAITPAGSVFTSSTAGFIKANFDCSPGTTNLDPPPATSGPTFTPAVPGAFENVTVTAPPTAPVCTGESVTVGASQTASIDLTNNCTDVNGNIDPATYVVGPLTPAQGTLTATAAPGVYSFAAPAVDPGLITFTFTVADTGGLVSNSATVSITVLANQCDATAGQCSLTVIVVQPVVGTTMTMDKVTGVVVMTPVVLNGQAQVSTGAIKSITVNNARGTAAGWSVTGYLTDLGAPGAPTISPLPGVTIATCSAAGGGGTANRLCIPGDNMGWGPTAAIVHNQIFGDVAAVTPGPASAGDSNGDGQPDAAAWLGELVNAGAAGGADFGIGGLQTQNTLCSAPVNQSGGTFRCDAALWLGVPASAGAGTYTGGLVLTLV